jgi:hypothetical protein
VQAMVDGSPFELAKRTATSAVHFEVLHMRLHSAGSYEEPALYRTTVREDFWQGPVCHLRPFKFNVQRAKTNNALAASAHRTTAMS